MYKNWVKEGKKRDGPETGSFEPVHGGGRAPVRMMYLYIGPLESKKEEAGRTPRVSLLGRPGPWFSSEQRGIVGGLGGGGGRERRSKKKMENSKGKHQLEFLNTPSPLFLHSPFPSPLCSVPTVP